MRQENHVQVMTSALFYTKYSKMVY